MSSEEFFGRPITEGTEEIEFDICEICQRKSPTWLEIQYQDGLPVVRFACSECHQQYMEQKDMTPEEIARQIKGDEEITGATRPGWVDEFIQEGENTIETIDSEPVQTTDEGGNENEPEKEPEPSSIGFSEAPETFRETEVIRTEEVTERRQIASWAPKFIQEALFGPNPEEWLEEQGGYQDEALPVTITTLGSFAGHDVSSVKLSAIQCLGGAINRSQGKHDQIREELERYLKDPDETIVEFAKQTIGQLG